MNTSSVILPILSGIFGALFNLASGGATLTAVFAYWTFGMSAMVMIVWWAWLRHANALTPAMHRY